MFERRKNKRVSKKAKKNGKGKIKQEKESEKKRNIERRKLAKEINERGKF